MLLGHNNQHIKVMGNIQQTNKGDIEPDTDNTWDKTKNNYFDLSHCTSLVHIVRSLYGMHIFPT